MIRFDFPKVFSTQFQFVLSIVFMKGRKEAKNDRLLLLTFTKYEDPIEIAWLPTCLKWDMGYIQLDFRETSHF